MQKVTIYLHKNIRKVRLERKINQEKQTNEQTKQQQQQQQKQKQAKKIKTKNSSNKKSDTQPIFPKYFSQVVYLFLFQESVY